MVDGSGVSSTASRVAVSASIGDDLTGTGLRASDGLDGVARPDVEDRLTVGFGEVAAVAVASAEPAVPADCSAWAGCTAGGADLAEASAAASAAEAWGSTGVAEAAATAAASVSETAGLAEAADVAEEDRVAALVALAVLGAWMTP